jgi:hypothetical protein
MSSERTRERLTLKLPRMKLLICILISTATMAGQATSSPKRIYIEERIKTVAGASSHCDTYGNCYGTAGKNERNVSLEATREFTKRCPNLVIITDNRDKADYDLRISPGNSTLYKSDGDVAYTSPTKYRVGNLAKDVCSYIESQSKTP